MRGGGCASSSSPSNVATHLVEWTREENNFFEESIARFGDTAPKLWERIAANMPGKTPEQLQKHYQALVEDIQFIESGRALIPRYADDDQDQGEEDECMDTRVKRRGGTQDMEQERKKGIPWTVEEHRKFLQGLNTYGKGDWRSISRNVVLSRTPTQVASHAQKFFNRIDPKNKTKERRRPSIHDITTASLPTPVAPINSNIDHIPIAGPATQAPSPNTPPFARPLISDRYALESYSPSPPPSHHQMAVSGSYPPTSIGGLENYQLSTYNRGGPSPSHQQYYSTSHGHRE